MAAWIKTNIGVMVAVVVLAAGIVAGYSRLETQQEALCEAIKAKADRQAITREMDLIHGALMRIEAKMDRIQGGER